MAPHYDVVDTMRAMQYEAIPALNALADNPRNLERGYQRFEDPPSYRSRQTASEADTAETDSNPDLQDFPNFNTPPEYEQDEEPARREFATILEKPLDNTEVERAATQLIFDSQPPQYASWRFAEELEAEVTRISRFLFDRGACSSRTRNMFNGVLAKEHVIARHFVRKRWKRLGVWNDTWDTVGDDYSEWSWAWEKRPLPYTSKNHMIRHAMRLRWKAPRNGKTVTCKSDKPLPAWSDKKGESFLISRPWFAFRLEIQEEVARLDRLTFENRITMKKSLADIVSNRWREQGLWNDEWNKLQYNGKPVVGWTWPDEPPAPELEDVSQLNAMDEMDLTPTEWASFESARDPIIQSSRPPVRQKTTDGPPLISQTVLEEAEKLFPMVAPQHKKSTSAKHGDAQVQPANTVLTKQVYSASSQIDPEPRRRSARIAALKEKQSQDEKLTSDKKASKRKTKAPPPRKQPSTAKSKAAVKQQSTIKKPTSVQRAGQKRKRSQK